MRYLPFQRWIVTCALMLMACIAQAAESAEPASTPAAAEGTTPAESASPAEPATPGEASTSETAAATATPAPAIDEEDMKRAEFERVSKQYRKIEKDGQALYCRNEKRLGTRLGAPVCLTTAQLWERIRKAEEVRTDMRANKPGSCLPPMTCN